MLFRSIEDGKYKIPDPKRLNKSNSNNPFNEVNDDDDDLPF